MSDQLTPSLPQDSEAQRIGRLARKAFAANVPDSWMVDETDGDNDYGYDYQVQLIDSSLVKDIFRAQLKGKTEPELNAAKTHYSVQLDSSTVNYYARAIEPVLLVLCHVGSADQPKNDSLYYCWIDDEICRIRKKGVAQGQETVTFHVPVSNKLDANTDLYSYIENFRRKARFGDRLDVFIGKERPELSPQERLALAAKIVPSLESKSPALLVSLTDDSSTSWVEALEGSLQWHLQEAKAALRSGNRERCETLINEAGPLLNSAKPLEQADYWEVVGRLRVFDLDDTGANTAFDMACKLSNNADVHLNLWGETELRKRMRRATGPADLSDAKARLTSSHPVVAGLKARFTAAEGKYDEALTIAKGIEGVEGLTAQSIIFAMQAKWREAIQVCDTALAETAPLKDNAKLLLLLLRARARFSLALNLGESLGEEYILPVNGPAGSDIPGLKKAWSDISEAVMMLRRSGWPGNVELISDIWPHVAIMLGLQKEALPVMAEAADARPSIHTLQAGVELLAAQANDFKLALKANGRQPESERSVLRRVTLLHVAHRDSECVELMHSKGEVATSNPPMLGHAMSLAIFSAEKLIRPDLVSRWSEIMESRSDLAPFLAMHRYFSAGSKKILAKDAALEELEAEYERLGRPLLIAKQLLHELDPTRSDHATRVVELAGEITNDQLLNDDEYLLLAHAFATLHKWRELLSLSDQALERYEHSDRMIAMGALALDKLGKTAEARVRLQALVHRDDPDPFALNTYINIAITSGFTADAIKCLEGVLAVETDRHLRFYYLRHLLRLIQRSDPSSSRLTEIAWEIGQAADQESESEEGTFLTSVFSATLHENATLPDKRKEEFHRRLHSYTEKFPNSKILRSFSIPESPSAEDLIRIFNDAIGVDENARRWRFKVENQLSRGEIPVPYAWRPKFFLNVVSDLPTLWEVSKTSRWEQQQFHLPMALRDWSPAKIAAIAGRVPLLDLTALLVVHDLGIFDKLFELFPTIAIGKATLMELQHLLAPVTGSSQRAKCESLMSALKSNFEKIEQPSAEHPDDEGVAAMRWDSQEVVEIVKTNPRYFVYSDDALFRIYATEAKPENLSVCTLDVLNAGDRPGIFDVKEIAQHIATLCSWRVSLVVQARYLLALLPDELSSARSVSKGVDVLRSNELCNSLFSSIWHPEKSFSDLRSHMGSLLRDLTENTSNRIESVAALCGLWVSKVRLYGQSPGASDRLTAVVIAQAVVIDRPMDETTSQRLWNVFKAVIEVAYEPRMDDDVYDASIKTIASVATEIDQVHSLTGGRSVAERLRLGLTSGTSDHEKFNSGLKAALLSVAKRNR